MARTRKFSRSDISEKLEEKYTIRTVIKFTSRGEKPNPQGFWVDGRFHRGWADGSKTRMGVKYNRLIRLHVRLRNRK